MTSYLPALPARLDRVTSDLAVFSATRTDLTCLLLIDPLLDSGMVDVIRQQAGQTVPVHTMSCSVLKGEPALCPQLFELQADRHADLIAHALRYALHEQDPQQRSLSTGMSVCGVLFSRAGGAETARHLARQTAVYNPVKREPSFLGFFDRRVLPRLLEVCEPAQWNQLLGPIEHWFLIDRDSEWVRLSHLPAHETIDKLPFGPVTFTTRQWNKLEQIEWISQLTDLWLEESDALPHDFIRQTWQLLDQARHYSITEKKDAVAFTLHGLRMGTDFHLHPRLGKVLGAVAQGASYARESSKLSESDWQALTGSDPTVQINLAAPAA